MERKPDVHRRSLRHHQNTEYIQVHHSPNPSINRRLPLRTKSKYLFLLSLTYISLFPMAAGAEASSSSSSNLQMENLRTVNNGRLMENLRTVNTHLVKEALLCQNQMEHLQYLFCSIAADSYFLEDAGRDAFKLVISSRLSEAAANLEVDIAAATERERDLIKKIEPAIAEVNALEMQLLALVRENEEKDKELAELTKTLSSMERGREREKSWTKWLLPAAATATCMAATWALFTFCKSLKK